MNAVREKFHPPGCPCGICQAAARAAVADNVRPRPSRGPKFVLRGTQLAIMVTLFACGVAYGCHHYRPPHLHCQRDGNSQACWTQQTGTGSQPPVAYSGPCLASFRSSDSSEACP